MKRLTVLLLTFVWPMISMAGFFPWTRSPAPAPVAAPTPVQEKKPAVVKKTPSNNTTAVKVASAPDAPPIYYGSKLCEYPQFQCVKINKGESWDSLFPDETQRDLVQRLNRSYNYLYPGRVIVVPRDLAHVTLLDLAPFSRKINTDHEKQIIVDQDKLAWGAYDADGNLVKWGPISSGRNRCPDSNNACLTLTGIYRVFSKEDSRCKSDIFPIGKGGAKMPYCMYFHKGFALHGSDDMPGYRASHGCVRMFTRDAKWLNEEFVEMGSEKNNVLGTLVVVRPVTQSEKTL